TSEKRKHAALLQPKALGVPDALEPKCPTGCGRSYRRAISAREDLPDTRRVAPPLPDLQERPGDAANHLLQETRAEQADADEMHPFGRQHRESHGLERGLGLEDLAHRRASGRRPRGLKRLEIVLAHKMRKRRIHAFEIELLFDPPAIGLQVRNRA